MKILSYEKPDTVDKALELIDNGGTPISGGTWLKLMPKEVALAVDLSGLKLDKIRLKDKRIEIGAMVTLQQLVECDELGTLASGIVVRAVKQIMGVPFRNIATIGGTLVGRYGFSDLITPPLLALNTTLIFARAGLVSLEDYLSQKKIKGGDLLTGLYIELHDQMVGRFETLKKNK